MIMRVQEGFIFLDEYYKEGRITFSFALDMVNRNIVYSKECMHFLEDVKSIVTVGNTEGLVALNIFECKGNFERFICRGILGLDIVGCIMDNIYYKVPSTLSEKVFFEVYDYTRVEEIVKGFPRLYTLCS